MGASLVAGPFAHAAYAADRLDDPAILELGDRVEAVPDEAMQKAFPKHYGSWVEITLKGGEKRRSDVLDSYGTPANPMDYEALQEKFEGLVRTAAPHLDIGGVTGMIGDIAGLPDISALAAKFAE
jgi:2-methylcitrate dehydratase PrpD